MEYNGSTETNPDIFWIFEIHKAYLRHANQEKLYPERMAGRKLAGLKLEPAEVSERYRGNPPVTDVRGCQKEDKHDSEVEEEKGNADDDDAADDDAADDLEAVEEPGAANEGEAVEEDEDEDEDEGEKKEEGGSKEEAPKKSSPLKFKKKKNASAAAKEDQRPAKKSRS
ncbi:hypothetical protein CYMTET_49209 [Cymbomonas tetramitiformis]|uniref:Uncharacterized protein n=1 Tax=Cymbomonas tetramitiformis TaxID=36881 RepID=A0AAE0EUY3_9CHLO|nr:hypothetical protein CYMTET_49209 [Cymbomonas tetramitiformis]